MYSVLYSNLTSRFQIGRSLLFLRFLPERFLTYVPPQTRTLATDITHSDGNFPDVVSYESEDRIRLAPVLLQSYLRGVDVWGRVEPPTSGHAAADASSACRHKSQRIYASVSHPETRSLARLEASFDRPAFACTGGSPQYGPE